MSSPKFELKLNEITQCYIDKAMMLNDRDCIPADPTAEIIDVVAVIDRRLKRSFKTDKIHLKIFFDHWEHRYDEEDHYIEQFRSVNRYVYEIDKLYEEECPPSELELLINWAYVKNQDAFFAFLWYCERTAAKYAAESAAKYAAKYAAESAKYAEYAKSAAESAEYAESAESAEYAKYAAEYAESAKYAEYAKSAAKYAAEYAESAAEIKQLEFLRWCLGENQP